MRLRNAARAPVTAMLSTLLLLTPTLTSAFYLPGVAPTSYRLADKVPLIVNHLTPAGSQRDEQVRSAISFDYYHPALHFCQPEGGPKYVSESLGSILFGDRIFTSPFELRMGENETCKALCEEQVYKPADAKWVNGRIEQSYNINWLIDGLPAAQRMRDLQSGTEFSSPGFALGQLHNDQPVFNNHYDILIDFHDAGNNQLRVVGIEVQPSSRRGSKNIGEGKAECEDMTEPVRLTEVEDTKVTFTYSVYWRPSDIHFATRWDRYLRVEDPVIHWFSLTISTAIMIILTGMVGMILVRTLRKDIARYNKVDTFNMDDLSGTATMEDGIQEDSGWKLVHGDVFRSPKYRLLLSVLVGNGAQLFMMTGLTIVFAFLGFLSPSSRGSLGTVMILLHTLFGFVGGYVSARTYKAFHGESWKQNIAYTPIALPGIVFATFFLLNLFLWAKGSSGAVPFTTMLVIVGIWFIISVPLSVAGSWFGFKQPAIEPPVRTNQIPRQIPPTSGYLRPFPSMLSAGIMPFWAIFVELYFIMNSLWFHRIYYMFGFLMVAYGLMIIVCAAVTVLMVYFLLCAENYHWQWRSFFMAGTSALYVFAYALIYWVSNLKFGGFASGVLYFGYSLLISFLFFVLTGTIGFFSSWLFVHRIYGSIKVD